ncbi:uncharacterized protein LOC106134911 [Amyelois transitella]|uniref:uncharacterized protein LOC106134911 n=1 Tax=Amyelois transitella TaxID=680683 RepID=UPI00298FFBCC|nr:uncharacterized protein LOC106134911 [Amyelois transitella]
MKNTQRCSQYKYEKYALPQNLPLKLNVIMKEENHLPYRLYAKEQDKNNHKHQLSINLQQKYKIALSGYRNRLYVKDPPNEVKALTDIDKDFFNYVNGRSLADHVPLYRTLKVAITNQLRTKLETGYRRDDILHTDKNHINEMNSYKQGLEMVTQQAKCLDIFILEDYSKSIELLKKYDSLHHEVQIKLIELKVLADQQFKIVSSLIGLDYMYYLQQSYGRFLYYLSPPGWRGSNRNFAQSIEIEVKGFDLGGGGEKSFNVIFEKMRKECLSDLVSPALYFTQSQQIIQLFEFFEKQQLNYLEYITLLDPLIKHSKEEIRSLKDIIAQQSAGMLNSIKSFEILLEFSEERCAYLKNKFFKIVNGLFYECTSAPEVVKLTLDLEFVYEEVLSEEPVNVDISTMMKSLESFYMFYCNRFDGLFSDTIKKAVKQSVEMERLKFKRARRAHRELCIFENLKRSLLRAFAPPASKFTHFKERVRRESAGKTSVSKLKTTVIPNMTKSITKKISLGEAELEYLTLFTDWSHGKDPSEYLHLE